MTLAIVEKETEINNKEVPIDYEKLYNELYTNTAKMLVENKTKNWTPETLLNNWDFFRK